MAQRENPMPTITTLVLCVRRAARQRTLWSVLVVALGVTVPVAVDAAPGVEFLEEALQSARAHARLVRSDALVSRAAPASRVAPARLPHRPTLDRCARPMFTGAARKIPPAVCDSPATTPDH